MKKCALISVVAFAVLAGAAACGSPHGDASTTHVETSNAEQASAPLVLAMGPLDMTAVHDAEERAAASRAAAPSIRRPFLRGHFETRNKAFPIEVEQAMAGVPTDHAVIVWAGPSFEVKK